MTEGIDRRTLLQHLTLGATMAAGGISLWPMRRARAQGRQVTTPGRPLKDRYYIFCNFAGGWDLQLSLDPKDPTIFTQQAANQTRIYPGYDTLDPNAGPSGNSVDGSGVYLPNRLAIAGSNERAALGAFMGELTLDRNLADICIVRGVNMNTLAHQVGQLRARTGRAPVGLVPRGSSAATWLARHYNQAEIAPNFALRDKVFNVDQAPQFNAFNAATVTDLITSLTPSPLSAQLNGSTFDAIDAVLDGAFPCSNPGEYAFMESAAQGRLTTDQLLQRNIAGQFDFLANTAEMDALRLHYGFTANPNDLTLPVARGALAVKAITSGFARVVSVTIADELDGHFGSGRGQNWPREHGPNQKAGFDTMSRMMEPV